MGELLKNMFNQESLSELTREIQKVYQSFDEKAFLASTMDSSWETLELKERVRQISTNLGKYLPSDYREAIVILDQVVEKFHSNFFGICFPDFVEVYGQGENDLQVSIDALARYTVYSSSEFAVRAFIIKEEEKMMAQMYDWSKDENEHIRRLSSEGCRPQLPWGQALTKYKKDPSPILPILSQLKADPSLYVRKSVANNINDISKTHPHLVIELAKEWYGENEYTNWIVKHGCRTLLKKGNPEVLAIFGYNNISSIKVENLSLDRERLLFGETIEFSYTITAEKATKVRMEYGMDFMKANGKNNRKIFQISEITLGENETKEYRKKHSFKEISTRKYYPGNHAITLIVNGVECGTQNFELEEKKEE
ncbi:DNA alkylation repair protein [Lachnospiraceae bacterium OttesenSCG-928-D06]|nr:DNA alkylation repair protein [Lachnospiraceae bacterium OttesenSCG-928-D06]